MFSHISIPVSLGTKSFACAVITNATIREDINRTVRFLGIGSEVVKPGALFLICQEPVEAKAYQKGALDRAE